MSHDTDKLIRQLSLVAFLMAELRPLTARDIKGNVEGYQEMSDEAFARRFYSDRAELVGLGVPLDSQRDEFTGEELYTLRSERYFLPPLDLDDDELAALQTCLFMLEGRFAYAEPLRLALQNLALGRAGGVGSGADCDRRQRRGARPRLHAGAPGPARQARGGDLEAADGPLRLLVDRPRRRARADDQPVRAAPRERHLVRDRPRPRGQRGQELPRLAHPLRDPLRDPPGARLPRSPRPSTSRSSAAGPSGSSATPPDEARVAVAPDTAWWVQREYAGPRNRVEDGVFVTEYASLPMLARWILRQEGRAVPLEPSPSAASSPRAYGPPGAPTRAPRRSPAAERPRPLGRPRVASARPGPVAPERFGVLQSLLAYLLAACGEERDAVIPAAELVERFSIPAGVARGAPVAPQPRQLRRRLLRRLRRAARRRGARRQGALRRHVPAARLGSRRSRRGRSGWPSSSSAR